MKVSRIYPYIKTKGECCHEAQVKYAKKSGFHHSGSKSGKVLYYILKNKLYHNLYNTLKFLR